MKGMKRTTLIMVVLGAAIGGVVWWEMKRGDEGDRKDAEPVELFPFIGEEVVKVEILRQGKLLSVEKKEASWHLTSPHTWPASTMAMMIMLRGVDPAEKGSPVPAGSTAPAPAVHGLDEPEMTVTLTAGDGRKSVIAFGKPLGAGDRVFARRAGQTEVLTVSRIMYAAFARTPESLRDPGFCRFDFKSVNSLSWTSEGKTVRVARQGRGWRLTGTVDDLADPAALEEWAGRLSGAVTDTFAARPKPSRADFGLDPPFASFEIVLAGRTIRMSVGAPVAEGDKRRWADTSEYPDDIGTISAQDLEILTPVPGALRATRALPWPLAEVEAITASGNSPYEARKEGGTWTLVKPALLTGFAPTRVMLLLNELSAATAATAPAGPAPEGAVKLTLRFGSGATAVEQTVEIWADGTDSVLRTTDPERVVRSFGRIWADHTAVGAYFFRDPVVPTGLVPLQVKSVSITDRNGVNWVEAELDGRAWKLTAPVAGGKLLDSDKMARLNALWASMVAETWVPEGKSSPVTGLAGAPRWKVRIIPDPGRASSAAERVFLVGNDGPGNSMYAMLEGTDGVFLVDPAAAGMLRGGVWKE